MSNIRERFTPEKLLETLVSTFIMGGKGEGMKTEDVMGMFDIEYYNEHMRTFIEKKLRIRDINKSKAKARLLNVTK